MLKSEKRKLVSILEEELSDLKFERKNNKESPYFIDYLYGVSDVNKEVNKLLHLKKSDEWILLYQVLLKKDIINSKEYYLYNLDPNSFFIMKNTDDFKRFKTFYMKEIDTAVSEYKNKIAEIYNKYFERFTNNNDKETFKSLLENYFLNIDNGEESEEYIKATYNLGEFIKTRKRKKHITFKHSDFFKEELGFKNTKDYPKITEKYKELYPNEK